MTIVIHGGLYRVICAAWSLLRREQADTFWVVQNGIPDVASRLAACLKPGHTTMVKEHSPKQSLHECTTLCKERALTSKLDECASRFCGVHQSIEIEMEGRGF